MTTMMSKCSPVIEASPHHTTHTCQLGNSAAQVRDKGRRQAVQINRHWLDGENLWQELIRGREKEEKGKVKNREKVAVELRTSENLIEKDEKKKNVLALLTIDNWQLLVRVCVGRWL